MLGTDYTYTLATSDLRSVVQHTQSIGLIRVAIEVVFTHGLIQTARPGRTDYAKCTCGNSALKPCTMTKRFIQGMAEQEG